MLLQTCQRGALADTAPNAETEPKTGAKMTKPIIIYVSVLYLNAYICIYIYTHTSPHKIYLCCLPRKLHDEIRRILQVIVNTHSDVDCYFCGSFKEEVSLEHKEHSPKLAVFLSERVQFSVREVFSNRSIIQFFFTTPDSNTT